MPTRHTHTHTYNVQVKTRHDHISPPEIPCGLFVGKKSVQYTFVEVEIDFFTATTVILFNHSNEV